MVFFILKQTHHGGTISDKRWPLACPKHMSLLLFMIYVNDLPLSLNSTCADIFADDATIGTSSHSIDTLTTDLQNVLSWCNSNNMSLNVSKTKLMYISSWHKQQTLANCDHDVSIRDSKIQVSSVGKRLVTISNTLCWDAHIDHLIKSVIPI